MPPAPQLRACLLQVLADRMTLDDRLEQGAVQPLEEKRILAGKLMRRHVEMGDREAAEVVEEAFRRWPRGLEGLYDLAQQLLNWQGGDPALAQDRSLHSVRLRVGEDLLVAALVAGTDSPSRAMYTAPRAELLQVAPLPAALDADLADLLERPLSETHVHLFAIPPSFIFWLPLMLGLIRMDQAAEMIAEATQLETRDPRTVSILRDLWVARLAEAALLRLGLAAHLREIDDTFKCIKGLGQIGFPPSVRLLPAQQDVADLIHDFRHNLGLIGYQTPPLGGTCRILLNPAGEFPYRDCLTLAVERTIGKRLQLESPSLGERYLLAGLLRAAWCLPKGQTPPFWERALRRYIRIKQAFLKLLHYSPGVHGLDRFQARYDRWNRRQNFAAHRAYKVWYLADLRYQARVATLRWLASSTRQRLLPDAHRQGSESLAAHNLSTLQRRLELRLKPGRGWWHTHSIHAVTKGILQALETLRQKRPQKYRGHAFGMTEHELPQIQIGLVFHLIKSSAWSPADYDVAMRRIAAWLCDHPAWRGFIVGVDVAGKELECPPSRLAPAYRNLRLRLRRATRQQRQGRLRMRCTFHVGEDFRDLLSGVRQVDLAVRMLDLTAGDRLGHALAIGLDAQLWYQRRGRSLPLVGDHLLDLLWARKMLVEQAGPVDDVMRTLHNRMEQLGLFDLDQCAKAFDAWFSQPTATFQREKELRLALLQFCAKKEYHDEAEITEVVPNQGWIELVQRLQRLVIDRLDRRGIIVEANPTSNVLIGGLRGFEELPVFSLHPVQPSEQDGRTLRVSISTDDPKIFRTSLREEYAGLFEAARSSGKYSRRDILQWLDRLRQDSFDSSFLKRSTPSGKYLVSYLKALLGEG